STVGTQTEIYDYLRLLFARVGVTICRVCGREVHRDSPESAAEETLSQLPEGSRFYVLFPADAGLGIDLNGNGSSVQNGRNGDGEKRRKGASPRQPISMSPSQRTAHLMSLMQRGFTRLFHKGKQIDLSSPDDYKRDDFDEVYVLVDRLTAREDVRQRLVDSLETCFREGHGQAIVEVMGAHASGVQNEQAGGTHLRFSERFECKYGRLFYATPEPRLFSFNNPFGACPTCQGFGNTIGLDLNLV